MHFFFFFTSNGDFPSQNLKQFIFLQWLPNFLFWAPNFVSLPPLKKKKKNPKINRTHILFSDSFISQILNITVFTYLKLLRKPKTFYASRTGDNKNERLTALDNDNE